MWQLKTGRLFKYWAQVIDEKAIGFNNYFVNNMNIKLAIILSHNGKTEKIGKQAVAEVVPSSFKLKCKSSYVKLN